VTIRANNVDTEQPSFAAMLLAQLAPKIRGEVMAACRVSFSSSRDSRFSGNCFIFPDFFFLGKINFLVENYIHTKESYDA
jgi:hypothetical protein